MHCFPATIPLGARAVAAIVVLVLLALLPFIAGGIGSDYYVGFGAGADLCSRGDQAQLVFRRGGPGRRCAVIWGRLRGSFRRAWHCLGWLHLTAVAFAATAVLTPRWRRRGRLAHQRHCVHHDHAGVRADALLRCGRTEGTTAMMASPWQNRGIAGL